MIRSSTKILTPILVALCAGCGAENMGPVDGEENIDSAEEALGGVWVSGLGSDSVSFLGAQKVCEARAGFPAYWYPGWLGATGPTNYCMIRDVFNQAHAVSSGWKTLRGQSNYALSFPPISDALAVSTESNLRLCVTTAWWGIPYPVGWVSGDRCVVNSLGSDGEVVHVVRWAL